MRRLLALLILTLPAAAQQTPLTPEQQARKAAALAEGLKARNEQLQKQIEQTRRWFESVHQTLLSETFEAELVGRFPFANPEDTAVAWTALNGNCACSKALIRVGDRAYEMHTKPKELVQLIDAETGQERVPVGSITVGPHERGQIDIHVQVSAMVGAKVVTLDIHTDHPAAPMMRLQVNAVAPKAITVEPEVVDLGTVPPGTRREFTVTASSELKPDFGIVSIDRTLPFLTATFGKEQREGRNIWTIRGVFVADRVRSLDGAVRAVMRFRTDWEQARAFTVNLRATVAQPIVVRPGVLTFGTIPAGKSAVRSLRFEPQDGSTLRAESITFDKPTIPEEFLLARAHQDGGTLVVDVEIAADAPPGLVRGDLVVRLDHAEAGPYRILFNGFVR